MLFTIFANVVALGAVAALVSAVIKKDRESRPADGVSGDAAGDTGQESPGTTAGRSS